MVSSFILAISTSSGVAKVAAAAEPSVSNSLATCLFSFDIDDYKSQSAQVLPLIRQHLALAGLSQTRCVAVAVDIGPGGFTSLRTACGIAQGLAVAWKVPTVPLTSFECMLPAQQQNQPVTVLMDARLGEIYAACIQRTEMGTQWTKSPYLLALAELHHIHGPVVCDTHLYTQLRGSPPRAEQGEVCAIRLAQLAWQEFLAGRVATPFDCQPLYVRDKVAQTTTERLALKHGAV